MKTILKGLVGSHAYGYATQNSDEDWMSVSVADLDNYFGLKTPKSSQTFDDNEDNISYEFKKFMQMCSSFNPNVVPLLFLKSYAPETNEYGHRLVEFRNTFLSKAAYAPLVGYALSQEQKASKNVTGKLGEKRKVLIETHGYDVKGAAHTVRLLQLAKHLFTYNEVVLDLSAEVCAEYRSGKYSVDDFHNHLQVLKKEVDEAYLNTKLPKSVDMESVNRFCVKFLVDWFMEH